jgi:hypothetical protein
MAESESYKNKAHRAAVLVFKTWPGWKRLRDDLQYAAYFICPEKKTCVVFAYSPSVMRPSGWKRMCNPIDYTKIPGLFEAVPRYQEMKAEGKLTEFGLAPSLRRPRKQYKQEDKKRQSNDDRSNDDEGSEGEAEVECQDSEDEDFISDAEELEREQYIDAVRMRSSLRVRKAQNTLEDHFYDINYRNIIKVALRYREHHGITSTELAEVLAQMCQNGWAFCKQIQKQGILDTYFTEITAQCEGKSSFTKEIISLMRKPVRKRALLSFTEEADEEVVEASPLEQEASPSESLRQSWRRPRRPRRRRRRGRRWRCGLRGGGGRDVLSGE